MNLYVCQYVKNVWISSKRIERNVGILFHKARSIIQSNDYFVITLYYLRQLLSFYFHKSTIR